MAEYIERTEELILAVNAGARAIENTKRYHGSSYCLNVFSNDHKEIPYLKAAEVLRGFDEIPTADVAPVVRCKDCEYYNRDNMSPGTGWCECLERGEYENHFCSYGERKGGAD